MPGILEAAARRRGQQFAGQFPANNLSPGLLIDDGNRPGPPSIAQHQLILDFRVLGQIIVERFAQAVAFPQALGIGQMPRPKKRLGVLDIQRARLLIAVLVGLQQFPW